MNSNNQNNIQKSSKNKIIVGITAFVIIICIAVVATTIIMPKVSEYSFKEYALGNAFVHYGLIDERISECYAQSEDEKSAVSEGLELYYDEYDNYQCSVSDIQFNTEYEKVTHIVLRGNATEAAEYGFISQKFSGVNFTVTIDVPENVAASPNITKDDVKFKFDILN